MLIKSLFVTLILLSASFLSNNLFGKINQIDEKIRSGYGGRMSEEILDKLKANGFNAYMWGANRPSAVTGGKIEWKDNQLIVEYNEEIVDQIANAADWAYQRGIKLFITLDFNEYTLKALQGLGTYGMGAVEGPRAYNTKGIQPAPSPTEKKYWNGILQADVLCIAKIAMEHPGIAGILIDVEMYGGGGLQVWGYDTSFDNNSFEIFRKECSPRKDIPEVPIEERFNWLKENGLLKSYYDCLSNAVFENAKSMAELVNKENPGLPLGVYPFSINWFYNGFIRGLAEGTKKDVWIFSEGPEYELGYTPNVNATVSQLKKMGIPVRYVGGLWLRYHSPFNLGWNAGELAEKADGYWLFTTDSLFGDLKRFDGPDGSHYRLAGDATQEQCWQVLKAVNQLIDQHNIYTDNRRLITPNLWAANFAGQTKVSYTYLPSPDGLMVEDANHSALFDGCSEFIGSVAWSLSSEQIDKKFSTTVNLGMEYTLDRIALSVPVGSLKNLKLVDKVALEVQYQTAAGWKSLARMKIDDKLNPGSYFNVNIPLDNSVKTNMMLITLQPLITEEEYKILIDRWDGLFLGLSEVAIWSK